MKHTVCILMALGLPLAATANTHTISVLAGFSYNGGNYSLIYDPHSSSGPNGNFTFADGINNLGQVVGIFGNSNGDNGYLYSGGAYYTISVPGADALRGTDPNGINNLGQIVGGYGNGNTYSSFIDTNDTFITLDPFGNSTSYAFGINDTGDVVGEFFHDGVTSGFSYVNGTYFQLDDPLAGNSGSSDATGINNLGDIVGTFYDGSTKEESFIYENGTYTTIDYPGSIGATVVWGIDDNGNVIGDYYNLGIGTPFIYSAGVYTTVLNSGGGYALGINDNGIVVGYRQSTVTISVGVPEIDTWALMLIGIAGVGAMLRSARRPAAATA